MRNFDSTLDLERKIAQSRQAVFYLTEIEEMLEGVDFDRPIEASIEIGGLILKARRLLIELIRLNDPTFCRLGKDLLYMISEKAGV